jgi:DNA topoisomerase-1
MNLVNAQQARRVLDRLVGYKLSPLLWRKIRKGLSAGRVQTVAVRLVVEREREIEKFVPKEYWQIFADLRKYLGGKLPDAPIFTTLLIKKNGGKIEIGSQIEAEDTVDELKKAGYEVGEVEKKDSKRYPPAPFTTSTMQQAGANRLGWSSKRTMQVAQLLYEQGLITYHRTDSTQVAFEAIGFCRDFIKAEYGEKYLPESPRIYKAKTKVAQEAHEAVRPTRVETLRLDDQKDEGKLYELIWRRFVACQMREALVEETVVDVNAAGQQNIYTLEARGEVEKFKGWKILYDKNNRPEDSPDQSKDQLAQLPPLTKGDLLELQKIRPLQKFTQPPPRFNEASLIKTLEELGIGRPSTYAPTISTILERMYVEKQEGKFVPTALGFAVNDFLMEYFPDVFDYQFTAHLEDDLDEIANGKQEWVPVIKEFYEPFNLKLTGVHRVAERVAVEAETTGERCPECGQGQVVIRVGRFGKFLSCSRFPACTYRAPHIAKTGLKCPRCQGDVVYKKTKKGKGFYGCINYPKCDFASWHKPTR